MNVFPFCYFNVAVNGSTLRILTVLKVSFDKSVYLGRTVYRKVIKGSVAFKLGSHFCFPEKKTRRLSWLDKFDFD